MKRKLISQMRHEWRGNLWIVIELIIVSLILWFIFTMMWGLLNVRLSERGYDTDNLYFAEIHFIPEESQFYQPYDSVHSQNTDAEALIAGLRANPHVEILGSGASISVYNYNYNGFYLTSDTIQYSGNIKYVTPDVIRAYRIQSRDGHSTEQLAEVIERGEIIISEPDVYFEEGKNNPWHMVGKDAFLGGDTASVRRVSAVAYGLRRSDYEPQWGVVYYPMPENGVPQSLVIRVRPGKGDDFVKSLTRADKTHGNAYLAEIRSAEAAAKVAHLDYDIQIRNSLICAVFLLLVIFLGFLGTFWFRTQQRVEEIAVRIVNGATRSDIFRRFIGEGLILLAVAAVVATVVILAVVHEGLISELIESFTPVTLASPMVYQGLAMSVGLMALLIVAGIWFPARKAMNINPAYALKDQ